MRRPIRKAGHTASSKSTIGIPVSRLSTRDAAAEAVAGIVQRPGRSALTMLGTILGVGAFVAVLGLTTTAAGQISRQFTVLDDTRSPSRTTARPTTRRLRGPTRPSASRTTRTGSPSRSTG